jgi:archaellin
MKKAEVAMGAMILFIAMLIVTAATIAVFFQVSQRMQNTAKEKSDRSTQEIISKLQVISVFANNGSIGKLKNFFIDAKLAPGSPIMLLNNSVLNLQLSNKSVTLTYKNKPCVNVTSAAGNGYYTNPVTSVGNFSIIYLETGNNYTSGRIDNNDIIRICISSPRYVTTLEQVGIRFTPADATANYISFMVPQVLVNTITQLYP